MELSKLLAMRKTGDEHFLSSTNPLDITMLHFWQWSASDLVSNTARGLLAEFIVASALGLTSELREEWRSFDLLTASGRKIEVKSCAYLQAWGQRKLSKIVFSIRPTRAWDVDTGALAAEIKRQAHVYVFALLTQKDKAALDPLNLDQWEFYVVPTALLDARSGNSINLKSLQQICPVAVSYTDLRNAVEGRAASG
ncbi:MAG: hypothetical protein JWM08_1258 [Candidatus Angelobacter sp.]|nr:hypothetical protein [Candidatus Angelobacter sp.]